jgi:hemerythrin-like domain-containing protein
MLRTLNELPADDERWEKTFDELRENVLHHVRKEEVDMYEMAQQVLSDEDEKRLEKEYEQRKKSA